MWLLQKLWELCAWFFVMVMEVVGVVHVVVVVVREVVQVVFQTMNGARGSCDGYEGCHC